MNKKKEINKNNDPECNLTKFDPKELRRLNNLKLTKAKQNRFLDLYSQYPNMTKCAKQVGVSITAIKNTQARDPEFKKLMEDARNNISEDLKYAMVKVGSQHDARGSNDRFRWLQAYDEDFKIKPTIQLNQQINITAQDQIDTVLQEIVPDDD